MEVGQLFGGQEAVNFLKSDIETTRERMCDAEKITPHRIDRSLWSDIVPL
jgi:hypothetical protein